MNIKKEIYKQVRDIYKQIKDEHHRYLKEREKALKDGTKGMSLFEDEYKIRIDVVNLNIFNFTGTPHSKNVVTKHIVITATHFDINDAEDLHKHVFYRDNTPDVHFNIRLKGIFVESNGTDVVADDVVIDKGYIDPQRKIEQFFFEKAIVKDITQGLKLAGLLEKKGKTTCQKMMI